jgi:hypothetical protein
MSLRVAESQGVHMESMCACIEHTFILTVRDVRDLCDDNVSRDSIALKMNACELNGIMLIPLKGIRNFSEGFCC